MPLSNTPYTNGALNPPRHPGSSASGPAPGGNAGENGVLLHQVIIFTFAMITDAAMWLVHALQFSETLVGLNAEPISTIQGVGDWFAWTDLTLEGLLSYMLAAGATAIPVAIYFMAHKAGAFSSTNEIRYRGRTAMIAFGAIIAILFVALVEFYSFFSLFKSVGFDPFNPGGGMDRFKAFLCAAFATVIEQLLAALTGGIYAHIFKKG